MDRYRYVISDRSISSLYTDFIFQLPLKCIPKHNVLILDTNWFWHWGLLQISRSWSSCFNYLVWYADMLAGLGSILSNWPLIYIAVRFISVIPNRLMVHHQPANAKEYWSKRPKITCETEKSLNSFSILIISLNVYNIMSVHTDSGGWFFTVSPI